MTESEKDVDEIIRTICFVVAAMAVVAASLWYLKGVLIPFYLALSLKHLLTPLIDALSCAHNSCRFKLPRSLAILLSFALAVACLVCLALVFAYSVAAFGAHADVYNSRIIELLDKAMALIERIRAELGLAPVDGHSTSGQDLLDSALRSIVGGVQLSSAIKALLGATGEIAEHTIYIVLFLIFMLMGEHGPTQPEQETRYKVKAAANAQIKAYIKGMLH